MVKSLRPLLKVNKIGGAVHLLPLASYRDPDQPLWIRVRERLEKHRIHNAEDRRVRPDAQAEREYGNEGEARISPQHPQAVTQILKECLDKSDSTHLAIRLL